MISPYYLYMFVIAETDKTWHIFLFMSYSALYVAQVIN